MARIRTIKPEFFLDDELAELSPLTRLLFIGLWTLADCEGRIEDRPKRIRAQILPFDDGDTNLMLQSLHDAGFIRRYSVGGRAYLLVTNFTKHQRLSGNEAQSASDIPAPCDADKQSGSDEEAVRKQSGSDEEADNVQEGKGKERKGKEEKNIAAPGDEPADEKPAASAAVRFDAAEFLSEHGADQQTAADYLTLRKVKKAASTATAMRAIVSEAGKAHMAVQLVLEICCSRGWVGFKAEWVESQQARDGPRQTRYDQCKATLDELTGRNRHATETDPRDITAEVIRIA